MSAGEGGSLLKALKLGRLLKLLKGVDGISNHISRSAQSLIKVRA